jgi:hypothetical protein
VARSECASLGRLNYASRTFGISVKIHVYPLSKADFISKGRASMAAPNRVLSLKAPLSGGLSQTDMGIVKRGCKMTCSPFCRPEREGLADRYQTGLFGVAHH